jgi:hypothetical protein
LQIVVDEHHKLMTENCAVRFVDQWFVVQRALGFPENPL